MRRVPHIDNVRPDIADGVTLWVPVERVEVEDPSVGSALTIPVVPLDVEYFRIDPTICNADARSADFGQPIHGHCRVRVRKEDARRVTTSVKDHDVPAIDQALCEVYPALRDIEALRDRPAVEKGAAFRARMDVALSALSDKDKAVMLARLNAARKLDDATTLKISEELNVADVETATDKTR